MNREIAIRFELSFGAMAHEVNGVPASEQVAGQRPIAEVHSALAMESPGHQHPRAFSAICSTHTA